MSLNPNAAVFVPQLSQPRKVFVFDQEPPAHLCYIQQIHYPVHRLPPTPNDKLFGNVYMNYYFLNIDGNKYLRGY